MSHPLPLLRPLALATLLACGAAQAQNVAVVNGKAVPKSRVETLLNQAQRQGQPVTPELEQQVRDEVVMREMLMQEAEKRGLAATAEYRQQMELARQSILIRQLFADIQNKNPVKESDVKAEYDKFKAQAGGPEVRARHILVESEDQAKKLIAQLQAGASFEELAKAHSKDPGSAQSGGDLDFAPPSAYVPEFAQALQQMKKGELSAQPVKTPFGWHVIKVEDTREAQFPAYAEVKPQIEQRLVQQKLADFRDAVRSKAKTDYKFSQ